MSRIIKLNDEKISDKIYLLKGKRIMLDFDLAGLYGVDNKNLKRQVRRNITRFPEDFMIHISIKEWNILRRQFGTSSWGGSRYLPYAFTEQGIAMLSSVLNSKTAIEVNIQIIRVFTRMRELLVTHKDIFIKLEQLEKKLLKQNHKLNKQEEEIQAIFGILKELLNPPVEPRRKIGFNVGKEKD
ncbi:MAG: ORF6N domain-containing protein [Chitinophagales bacterium]